MNRRSKRDVSACQQKENKPHIKKDNGKWIWLSCDDYYLNDKARSLTVLLNVREEIKQNAKT